MLISLLDRFENDHTNNIFSRLNIYQHWENILNQQIKYIKPGLKYQCQSRPGIIIFNKIL